MVPMRWFISRKVSSGHKISKYILRIDCDKKNKHIKKGKLLYSTIYKKLLWIKQLVFKQINSMWTIKKTKTFLKNKDSIFSMSHSFWDILFRYLPLYKTNVQHLARKKH